ncbi:hypothetical protein BDZ94DRAFT_1259266 [Collybia nuda]|uniref:TNase-like domain-containing protein n=1 Tax=Collybia nuda TaxID=64659 RepID=A0A9P6CEW0_9AGAR|nr:hypothetical protein BDZ94DRAFT_1259266 [Collybia nuda]
MPTIPWPWTKPVVQENIDKTTSQFKKSLERIPPPLLALTAFAAGSATTVVLAIFHARYGRRLKNGDWITPDVFARKRWIKGVVTTVGDADNFRFYHTPAFGWRWPFKFRRVPSSTKALKDNTLHIRIGGVDAPEAAHFGRPAQPYSAESLAWLRDTILGKTVYCQPLRRDQYSRVVANVRLSPRILPGALVSGKNLSLEMLRAGWVTTYEQAGAEYGESTKEEFLRVEAEAKAAKRGMWKHGVNAETPAEYKRRHASASSLEAAEAAKPRTKQGGQPRGWLRRLFFL